MADLSRVSMLADFLEELARRRWQWGVTDCLMVGADWIARVRGIDPAVHFRGSYHDEASCRAVLIRHGGLVRLVGRALDGLPLARTRIPDPGDFALVRAPVARDGRIVTGHVGALVMPDGRVAVMTSDLGLVIADLPIIQAWAV